MSFCCIWYTPLSLSGNHSSTPWLIVKFSCIRIEPGKTSVIKPFFPIPGWTVKQTAVT